ncbi:MAG: hypothetical protein GY867_00315, partial [bacterium]|nr:hypothetical protein [bacterium]
QPAVEAELDIPDWLARLPETLTAEEEIGFTEAVEETELAVPDWLAEEAPPAPTVEETPPPQPAVEAEPDIFFF